MSASVQNAFASSLRSASAPTPHSLGDRSDRRFAVYGNNVSVSLSGALATRFPAVKRIVGDDFFAGLARAYVSARPPRSPVMMTYGDDFSGFIAAFPDLEELSYLADVARLEAARTRAYHAADVVPIGSEAFAALDAETFGRTRIALHPSVEIVRSTHPVVTIWAMNAGEVELGPVEDWRPEDALVSRPEMEVVVRRLPAGGATFLTALGAGVTLASAAARAAAEAKEFDLTQNLVGVIGGRLAVRLDHAPKQGDDR